jgi:hypothetical protein
MAEQICFHNTTTRLHGMINLKICCIYIPPNHNFQLFNQFGYEPKMNSLHAILTIYKYDLTPQKIHTYLDGTARDQAGGKSIREPALAHCAGSWVATPPRGEAAHHNLW